MSTKSANLTVKMRKGQTEERAFAEAVLNPITANAVTSLDYSKAFGSDLSLQEVLNVMNDNAQQVKDGKLDYLESMLTSQATALNSMFNDLARRAVQAQNLPQYEAYLRMAFKAQSQCRTTVEAIGELKYPKQSMFIRQANIANQQQVNNGLNKVSSTRTGMHAGEKNITPSNELLRGEEHETLDARGTRTTSKAHSRMETLGKIDGRKEQRRKREVFDE